MAEVVEYDVLVSADLWNRRAEMKWPACITMGQHPAMGASAGTVRVRLRDTEAPQMLAGALVELTFRVLADGEVVVMDRQCVRPLEVPDGP